MGGSWSKARQILNPRDNFSRSWTLSWHVVKGGPEREGREGEAGFYWTAAAFAAAREKEVYVFTLPSKRGSVFVSSYSFLQYSSLSIIFLKNHSEWRGRGKEFSRCIVILDFLDYLSIERVFTLCNCPWNYIRSILKICSIIFVKYPLDNKRRVERKCCSWKLVEGCNRLDRCATRAAPTNCTFSKPDDSNALSRYY